LEEFYLHNLYANSLNELHDRLIKIQLERKKEAIISGLIGYVIIHFYRKKSPNNIWETIGHWQILKDIVIFCDEVKYCLQWNTDSKGVVVFIDGIQLLIENIWIGSNEITFIVNGKKQRILFDFGSSETFIEVDGFNFRFRSNAVLNEVLIEKDEHHCEIEFNNKILSPLFGRVVKINEVESNKICKGETILILESMKMENHITSPANAIVKEIYVAEGESVKENQLLVELQFQNEKEFNEVLP